MLVSPPLSLAWNAIITSYFVLLFPLSCSHNLAYTAARRTPLESKLDHVILLKTSQWPLALLLENLICQQNSEKNWRRGR